MAKINLVRGSALFLRHFVPAAIRPARTLWNEIIGFIFLVIALAIGGSAVSEAIHFKGDPGSLIKLVFSGIVTVIMAFYGVASFMKARRISRS